MRRGSPDLSVRYSMRPALAVTVDLVRCPVRTLNHIDGQTFHLSAEPPNTMGIFCLPGECAAQDLARALSGYTSRLERRAQRGLNCLQSTIQGLLIESQRARDVRNRH